MIYDSTFFIALERKRTRAAAQAVLIQYQDQPARLPVVVFGELAAGYDSRVELRANVEAAYTVELLTEEIAWHASRVQRAVWASRTPNGENDTWIAAFALAFDEPLATRDTEFDHVVAAGPPLRLIRC